MSSIQSPFHPHVLFLRNLSQHFQIAQREIRSEYGTLRWCESCGEDLFNGSISIYCCEKCGFYIHTSCARPAPLQIQHPRHEHPLGHPETSEDGLSLFKYLCVRGCKYELFAWDAMRTLQVEKYYCSLLQEASDGESRLQFAHEHPLTTFPVRTGVSCGGCKMPISEEEACGCKECNLFLHEACAKAPLEIQHHPFHPEHTLYLSYDSSCEGECHACRYWRGIGPIRYCCEECKLIFDLSCVISTMPRDDDDDDGEREDISRRPSVIDHPLHLHQLSSYHSKTHTKITCSICRNRISSENFFGCLDCSFFLHGSCAQPPIDAIQHYLHPEHTLTFTQCPNAMKHECAVCGFSVSNSYCYTCQMCDLLIHPFCASATLSELEKGVARTVQYPFHEHELKLYCNVNGTFCTVCSWPIYEHILAYKCFSQGCKFKIHKSCLQLPSELEHPSHSLHPLTFCFKTPNKDIACRGCHERIWYTSAFSCGECDFHLHVTCAQKPTLKHPFHEHHLFYFKREIKKSEWERQNNRKCRACHKSCGIDFFSCEECDYALHYECSQLPLTLKSEHHSYCEPLVLRESFIEDERAEYYCDICERRRDPQNWVYLCETCDYNFVAHVECALSPQGMDFSLKVILEVIEEDDFIKGEEDIQRREEEIRVAQEQVDTERKRLRPLMEELKSMRAKVELKWVELEERKAEHAKWINMGGIEEDESIRGEEDESSTGEEDESIRGEEDMDSTYLKTIFEVLNTEEANWLTDFLKTECNLSDAISSELP